MAAKTPRVVIIGGGFGGLYCAQLLGARGVPVTLIDKRNFHLFQPLLYQVATGYLSPSDIAIPLRTVLAKYRTVRVIEDEFLDLDCTAKLVKTAHGEFPYDKVIIATGLTHSYFGRDDWAQHAPGIKSIEDAVGIRKKVFEAFEAAERSTDPEEQRRHLTFAIVGGGATGVELAGALAELARGTLRGEFRSIDPGTARIVLFEGGERVLPAFKPETSKYTREILTELGVTVRTETRVSSIRDGTIEFTGPNGPEALQASTILWAAGVRASTPSQILAKRCGAELDRMGRVKVDPDLRVPKHVEIFVVGDLAAYQLQDGSTLPGVAQVAIQQGRYVARIITRLPDGDKPAPFRYFDKGNMAVIGRGRAVAESWKIRMWGLPAWLAWAVVHIFFLIEFENRFVVFFRWAWNYLTDKRGARVI